MALDVGVLESEWCWSDPTSEVVPSLNGRFDSCHSHPTCPKIYKEAI